LIALPLPKNETNALFRAMTIEIRDLYVGHSLHGLDGYLSVRIRHGALAAQLRAPLEAAYLVTPRIDAAGVYETNYHWYDRLSGAGTGRSVVLKRLDRFAAEYDNIVRDILKEWVQIKRLPDEKGLFDFTLSEHQMSVTAAFVDPNLSAEQFIEFVIDQLDILLEQSLARIRTKLDEANRKVSAMLDELQRDVGEALGLATTDIHDAVGTARTEVQVAFERVREWFRLSRVHAGSPYPIENAFAVASGISRTAARALEYHVIYESAGKKWMLHGDTLSYVVDVLYTIFDNIIRRSQVRGPIWHAYITVQHLEDGLRVIIRNQVGSIDRVAALERLSEIRSVLETGHHLGPAQREGRSGIYKVAKILGNDLHAPLSLDFGFEEDWFVIAFTLGPGTLT
jgi:hypothetical protein